MIKIKLLDDLELEWRAGGLCFTYTIKNPPTNTTRVITWFIPKRDLCGLIRILGVHKTTCNMVREEKEFDNHGMLVSPLG